MGLTHDPRITKQHYDPKTIQMRTYAVQGLKMAGEYKIANQVAMCARYVETTEDTVRDSRGEIHTWEQSHYRFCDKKVCPICHERSMKALRKESYDIMLATMEKQPDLVYCFLTLTSSLARNRYNMNEADRLRTDIEKFSKSFSSLQYSSFFKKHVVGVFWVLIIKPSPKNDKEIYRTGRVRYNIHLHAIMAVKRESITGKAFTKTALALEWQKALGARLRPSTRLFYDIRAYQTAKEEGRIRKQKRKQRRSQSFRVVGQRKHLTQIETVSPSDPQPAEKRKEVSILWDSSKEDDQGKWKQSVNNLICYITLYQRQFELCDYKQGDPLAYALGLLGKAGGKYNRYRFSGVFARNRVRPIKVKQTRPEGDVIEQVVTHYQLDTSQIEATRWGYAIACQKRVSASENQDRDSNTSVPEVISEAINIDAREPLALGKEKSVCCSKWVQASGPVGMILHGNHHADRHGGERFGLFEVERQASDSQDSLLATADHREAGEASGTRRALAWRDGRVRSGPLGRPGFRGCQGGGFGRGSPSQHSMKAAPVGAPAIWSSPFK